MDHRGKRVHLTEEEKAQQKLSYVQLAKLGYQELVNAIIRPPRAEYKVCFCLNVRIFRKKKNGEPRRATTITGLNE
jgi:hypothetical protein